MPLMPTYYSGVSTVGGYIPPGDHILYIIQHVYYNMIIICVYWVPIKNSISPSKKSLLPILIIFRKFVQIIKY